MIHDWTQQQIELVLINSEIFACADLLSWSKDIYLYVYMVVNAFIDCMYNIQQKNREKKTIIAIENVYHLYVDIWFCAK